MNKHQQVFHQLWTLAAGQPGYDKAKWKLVREAVDSFVERLMCVSCGTDITHASVKVGAGDGTGRLFRCRACHRAREHDVAEGVPQRCTDCMFRDGPHCTLRDTEQEVYSWRSTTWVHLPNDMGFAELNALDQRSLPHGTCPRHRTNP